jgi:hypothetical protein
MRLVAPVDRLVGDARAMLCVQMLRQRVLEQPHHIILAHFRAAPLQLVRFLGSGLGGLQFELLAVYERLQLLDLARLALRLCGCQRLLCAAHLAVLHD